MPTPTCTATHLSRLGGAYSYGYGINDSEWVTGYSATSGNDAHAFLYEGGTMHDLGTRKCERAQRLILRAAELNIPLLLASGWTMMKG